MYVGIIGRNALAPLAAAIAIYHREEKVRARGEFARWRATAEGGSEAPGGDVGGVMCARCSRYPRLGSDRAHVVREKESERGRTREREWEEEDRGSF